jgi:hypothetical protein
VSPVSRSTLPRRTWDSELEPRIAPLIRDYVNECPLSHVAPPSSGPVSGCPLFGAAAPTGQPLLGPYEYGTDPGNNSEVVNAFHQWGRDPRPANLALARPRIRSSRPPPETVWEKSADPGPLVGASPLAIMLP